MSSIMTQLTIKGLPILGTFGKGIKGSIAFNYGSSCGPDCDRNCPLHVNSISPHAKGRDFRCYAYGVERRYDRVSLANKLRRHQVTNRSSLTALARTEYKKTRKRTKLKVKWFRFSAFGSVPNDPPPEFRPLCEDLEQDKVDVHLPVESWAKTKRYRKELRGLNIAVRRSCHTIRAFVRASIHNNPISVVAGTMKQTPRQRLTKSKVVAKMRSVVTNRKTLVCPAVAAMILRTGSKTAKCGNCVACADSQIDIVYPLTK